jgi:hypothetical protein
LRVSFAIEFSIRKRATYLHGNVIVAVAALLFCGATERATAQPAPAADPALAFDETPSDGSAPPTQTLELPPSGEIPERFQDGMPVTMGHAFGNEYDADTGWSLHSIYPSHWFPPLATRIGLRHSSADGRHVGLGKPLVGTSWLNRPIYVGLDIGPYWMTHRIEDSVGRDTDIFGGLILGCDWDYYWGSELRFEWATPELINSEARDADRADGLFEWNANLLYYPWGDSTFRPYWRWGIGTAHFDFPDDDGHRRDETLLTFPLGIGMKYPLLRWLAARAEFTDHLSVGDDGLPTMHNLTLTLGLECRYGVHPRSYWPWNPSRHIW